MTGFLTLYLAFVAKAQEDASALEQAGLLAIAGAAGALRHRRLARPLGDQPRHPRRPVIARTPRQPRIDDDANAVERQAGLRDPRRQHQLARAIGLRPDRRALRRRLHAAVQVMHADRLRQAFQPLGRPLDLADAEAVLLYAPQDSQLREWFIAQHAPDEGVLLPDTDAAAGLKLRLGGAALRRIDVALLAALGVERVMVRQPRARVVCETAGTVAASAAALIASAIDAEGGSAITQGTTLEAALSDDTADAVVAIGGTGSGRSDSSVKTLARLGKVTCHGVAIAPGETTAIGAVGARPVLLLPGRADAALAGWLTIGRRMLARLAFRLIEDQPFAAELGRKVTSSLGLAEVVPVRRRLARVEPVAAGYLPLQSLIKAEGWILVPADSEGYPQGARVVVRPWP